MPYFRSANRENSVFRIPFYVFYKFNSYTMNYFTLDSLVMVLLEFVHRKKKKYLLQERPVNRPIPHSPP